MIVGSKSEEAQGRLGINTLQPAFQNIKHPKLSTLHEHATCFT